VTIIEVCVLFRDWAPPEVHVTPPCRAFPPPIESVLSAVPVVIVTVVGIVDLVTGAGAESNGSDEKGGDRESLDEVLMRMHVSNPVERCIQSTRSRDRSRYSKVV
jgi:hypothetical protein